MAYVEDLDRKMWLTRGARFNAHRRLTRKDRLSSYAIVLLSAYTTCLSIVDLTPGKHPPITSGLWTVIISLVTFAVSLLVAGHNYKGHAEQLHQCAKAISILYDQLLALRSENPPDLHTRASRIGQRYEKLIQSYSVNHEPIDNELFRLQHIGVFPMKWWDVVRIWAVVACEDWLYWLAIIGPPVVAGATLLVP